MIKYQRFRREFMAWRMTQLSEVRSLTDLTELPYGSILHVLDNFPCDGKIAWGPRADNYLINMNRFRLFMNNQIMWPEKKPTDVAPVSKEKLLLMNSGVMSGIAQYKRDMMPRVKYLDNLAEAPIIASTLSVVNYNPLFRARALGMRKKVRFFNFLLACLVNKINQFPDRQQFIHIPLEPFIYEKKHFLRTLKKYDKIATMFPERSSYLFLAHFYGIIAKPVSLPRRGELPKMDLEEGEESSVESLMDMDLNGLDSEEGEDWTLNCRILDEQIDAGTEALREGENPYKLTIFEFLKPQMYEKINFIFTVGNHYVAYNLRDLNELNGKANVGLLRIIAGINNLVRTHSEGAMDDELTVDRTAPEKVVTVDEIKLENGNITNFTKPLTHQEKIEAAEIDMLELDDVTKILDGMPQNSTPKQREHVVKLSKAYKNLTIDGIKFDKLMADFDDDLLFRQLVVQPPEPTDTLLRQRLHTACFGGRLNEHGVFAQNLRPFCDGRNFAVKLIVLAFIEVDHSHVETVFLVPVGGTAHDILREVPERPFAPLPCHDNVPAVSGFSHPLWLHLVDELIVANQSVRDLIEGIAKLLPVIEVCS